MNYQSEIIYKKKDSENVRGEKGYWFIFKKSSLLVSGNSEKSVLPFLLRPEEIGIKTVSSLYLGKLDSENLFVCEASDEDEPVNNCCGTAEHEFKNIREFYSILGEEFFALACRALLLKNWNMNWNFCPSCGCDLVLSESERAKICSKCGNIHYPVISPAIIVAVRKDDRLLLAHNKKYPIKKRYSIIAGFVEAGETFEETVHREVFEEVGLKVKNIKYFGSQSWPFPHSMMIGFTAEYDSGEITVDDVEIGHADWYTADNMPEIPPFGSISRLLIEDFKTKTCVKL